MIGPDPNRWFRNIPSGAPFDAGRQPLDYSLQISLGLSNFLKQQQLNRATPATRARLMQQLIHEDQRPPRDGGPTH
jgi:hypothetical protein